MLLVFSFFFPIFASWSCNKIPFPLRLKGINRNLLLINSPWTLKVLKNEFLPYHRKLYCIAYRLLENAADAEDLVQEAYLKLWDKREGLAIISNPEAFSVTLVKKLCALICFVQESIL